MWEERSQVGFSTVHAVLEVHDHPASSVGEHARCVDLALPHLIREPGGDVAVRMDGLNYIEHPCDRLSGDLVGAGEEHASGPVGRTSNSAERTDLAVSLTEVCALAPVTNLIDRRFGKGDGWLSKTVVRDWKAPDECSLIASGRVQSDERDSGSSG